MTSALVSSTPNTSSSSSVSSSNSSIPKIKLTFKANITDKDLGSSSNASQALTLQPPPKSKRQLGAPRRPYNRKVPTTTTTRTNATATATGRKRKKNSSNETFIKETNGAGGQATDSTLQSQHESDQLKSSNGQAENIPVYMKQYTPKWQWILCEVEVKTALEGAFKTKVWKRREIPQEKEK
jgi:hypothetical protein